MLHYLIAVVSDVATLSEVKASCGTRMSAPVTRLTSVIKS